ncbi:Hsp70 family protein [Phytohabitans aurantiacus]|uniref:Molecular chaperone DnaK n=1 Tax=Phytohabitans aurantiacus TaxID=3016789 RepID=A0ABQ5R6R3_9ACTN|nr:Hsp70 family protein [Phytohabitans aurantiacus]GLI02447.1 hypothetical protein Pa4123_77250 [Phytohabitans aurantiacus]
MPDDSITLGVDFGTSHTAAVLTASDGRPRQLLFDGGPQLRSAVFLDDEGELITGRDAVFAGQQRPERLEPFPKQRIDDGTVLLGSTEVPVQDLIAAVLRRVADEAARVAGAPAAQVVLTVPAIWGRRRREVFSAAAGVFGGHRLTTEPVAAAARFLALTGPAGRVGVFDLGAGTCDAAVVHAMPGGDLEVVAAAGLSDAGGLDVDAAILGAIGAALAPRDRGTWRRLTNPDNAADRRARWQLWESVRQAKEMLSRAAVAYVPVPLFDDAVPFGREQLDEVARPVLDRTVTLIRTVLRDAGVEPGGLSALYLVGGASRMPLVAQLLQRSLGIAPVVLEQPELVVAEGAALAAASAPVIAIERPEDPSTPRIATSPETHLVRRRAIGAATAVAAAATAMVAWAAVGGGPDRGEPDSSDSLSPRGAVSGAIETPTTIVNTPAPVIDSCLVGSWAITSLEIRNANINGRTMTLAGKGTTESIYTFDNDGTGALSPGSLVANGSAGGGTYRVEFKGFTSWTYEATDGGITYYSRLGNLFTVATLAGKSVNGNVGDKLKAGSDRYECDGDSAKILGTDFAAQLRRRS